MATRILDLHDLRSAPPPEQWLCQQLIRENETMHSGETRPFFLNQFYRRVVFQDTLVGTFIGFWVIAIELSSPQMSLASRFREITATLRRNLKWGFINEHYRFSRHSLSFLAVDCRLDYYASHHRLL